MINQNLNPNDIGIATRKLGYSFEQEIPNLIGIRNTTPTKFIDDEFWILWKSPQVPGFSIASEAQAWLNFHMFHDNEGKPIRVTNIANSSMDQALERAQKTVGKWRWMKFPITTMPRANGVDQSAVFFLSPGQHRLAYQLVQPIDEKTSIGIKQVGSAKWTGARVKGESNKDLDFVYLNETLKFDKGYQVFQHRNQLQMVVNLLSTFKESKWTYTLFLDEDFGPY